MQTFSVKIEKSGRILIPATIRKRLGLKEGTQLLMRVDEAGIQIGTREQALIRAHQELRRYIPASRNLSEELIEERRAEAERENNE